MAKTYQRVILKELAKGALIRVQYINHPPSSARRVYRLSTTQQLLREDLVRQLIEDRLIKPNADGLFGNEGPVQSYSLWRASEGGA